MARLRQEMKEEDREMAALDNVEEVAPKLAPQEQIIQVNEEELEGLDEDEQMQMLLGFTGGFGSTKGEAVEDNQASAARGAAAKNKVRKYRQYMNRKNGFNRPLEKMD
jgi:U4/U6.U5 tri-snRNP-associated protein 3